MPSQRLANDRTKVSRFDVIGADSDAGSFVGHAGLAASDADEAEQGDSIAVYHMKPPLDDKKSISIHVLGSASLTDDESKMIELFCTEHFSEHKAQDIRGLKGYIVQPHAADLKEADGTTVCRRFSCAGYVVDAYRDAGIDMLDTDPANLPQVNMATLDRAYPFVPRLRNNPQLLHRSGSSLDELGVSGQGPWPIVLPGYLFHALDRDAVAIRTNPYSPVEDDKEFP